MNTFDEKLISWFRYLYWAEICYTKYEELLNSAENPDDIPIHKFIAFSSQWYASLYVVIEGWQELEIQDNFINRILADHQKLINILRRYRNCIYHFQKNLIDKRFIDLAKTRDIFQLWIFLVHEQFKRYYSDYLANLPGNKILKLELIKSFEDLVGWIPTDSVKDRFRNLEDLLKRSESLLNKGNLSTKEAKEFQQAIDQARMILNNTKSKYQKYLKNSIRYLKVN